MATQKFVLPQDTALFSIHVFVRSLIENVIMLQVVSRAADTSLSHSLGCLLERFNLYCRRRGPPTVK